MATGAPDIPDRVRAKLDEILERRDAIERDLADPDVLASPTRIRDLSVARAAIEPVAERYRRLLDLEREAAELDEAASADDAELRAMAAEEAPRVRAQAAELLDAILADLVTAEDRAVAGVILEIRAGVGGDEAALWAGELAEMYRRYATERGWSVETDAAAPGEAGGVKHAQLTVEGEGAWAALAHEAGVHCVKRVPATEAQGRIHTSTATVAALPEPTEVQFEVDPADVDEHITTSQGPGGQNVNKVATAVHLLHRPTGVEVRMQETKSQRQNREKAWRLLRARLFEAELERRERERAEQRSGQIGGAGRAERIRTYRFKEGVAVDHRLGESFPLQKVLAGRLDGMAEALQRREIERRLESL